MIVVLSSSLNSESNSRVLARALLETLESLGQAAVAVDLRDYPLPLCDGGPSYAHPNVERVGQLLRSADAIVIATPIYNYDATAAVKNLIELTGDAWENKVVGFLCAAGGMSSFMSIMSLANSLMLDFRSLIIPRFVYTTGAAISNGTIVDPQVRDRILELARQISKLTTALKAA